jgi:hypothetical protein
MKISKWWSIMQDQQGQTQQHGNAHLPNRSMISLPVTRPMPLQAEQEGEKVNAPQYLRHE